MRGKNTRPASAGRGPDDLRARNVGPRYPRFDNGRTETVYAIEVDHPSGRWEQIWVLRDSALADRIVAALSQSSETTPDRLRSDGPEPDRADPERPDHPSTMSAEALDAGAISEHRADPERRAEGLTPLQREVATEPLCSRCERPISTLGGMYRCAQCHALFDLACICEHFGWGVNDRPHVADHAALIGAIEAAIQDLALGTPERILRAEHRLRALTPPPAGNDGGS